MSCGLIIGLVLILFGISIILKVFLNIDFPVVKTLFALFLIAWGVWVLLGKHICPVRCHGSNTTLFSECKSFNADGKEYNVVFGKATYDFTKLDPADTEQRSKTIKTVFGESIVIINKDLPVRISAETAFGNVSLPNGNASFMGGQRWESDSAKTSENVVDIHVQVVFGNCIIRHQ